MDDSTLREILTEDRQVRFWAKVKMISGGCWEWQAATNGVGYGKINAGGYYLGAHRVSYFLAHGSLPKGLHLDHLCRNTLCVRPDHLEAVTARENILRGTGYTARHARKSTCPNGHEYDHTRGGARACLTCDRAASIASQNRTGRRPKWGQPC